MIDVNAYLGHYAFRPLRHNTAPALLKLMDTKGIRRAVVSSASAITYRNAHAGNEEIAAEVDRHRDRLIPFAVLNPTYAGWQDDLQACHGKLGMKGIRLFPRWHNYKLSDPVCLDLVNAAAEKDMIVSIPVRVEDPRNRSWLVDVPDVPLDEIASLVRACPKAQFIIMNGIGFPNSALGRKNNGLPVNYVIEICRMTAAITDELSALIGNLGVDRLVFGTGMPFHYPDPAILKLEILDASDQDKERIRWRTAASLLHVGQ